MQVVPLALHRYSRRCVALFLSFAFAVLIAEFALRVTEDERPWKRRYRHDNVFIQQPPCLHDAHTRTTFTPNWVGKAYYAGGSDFALLRINSHGFRFPEYDIAKPHRTKRVALIGDSLTAAVQVEAESHFRTLFEAALNQRTSEQGPNTEVLNFGIPGTGPVIHLNMYRHYVSRFDPDLVVLSIYTGNDFTDEVGIAWRHDDGRLIDEPFLSASGNVGKYLKTNSCLAMLGWSMLRRPQLNAQVQRATRAVNDTQKTDMSAIETHELAEVTAEVFDEKLLIWETILKLCNSDHVPCIVVLFPEQGNDCQAVDSNRFLQKAQLHDRLARHFQQLAVPCVTYSELLPRHRERFGDRQWAKHSDYLSECGHKTLAAVLADRCAEILFPMSPNPHL